MDKRLFLLPAAAIVLAALLSSVFIVDERTKALVLKFGEIVAVRDKPGLYFKVPFINEVVRYDDRILGLDIEPQEVTPSDDRRLVVDAFARYRIADVVKFRRATGSGGQSFAEGRLDNILKSKIREVLGEVDSSAILSKDRAELATKIRDAARGEAAALGVEVVDVRLRRTDLPEQNLEATFARMRAEREREAADQVARGNEAAQRLRAAADRSVIETVSDAKRQAEIVRGEADAKRSAIFAKAYGVDPGFFAFYRSLAAYRDSLLAGNSSLILSPDSEFFDYLRSSAGTPVQK
ncbi:MAG: protease modulator HflC [Proteobacteria bacterium]|nr:protease modulator HflC [Pseudomonadota bacterium]MBS0573421.1 protease modulator HflC [Pseudomonadota bacterium]